MSWIAVAIGGSALVGAGASMYGAGLQADAAGQAAGLQAAQFQQTQRGLDPYARHGMYAAQDLSQLLGIRHTPGGASFDPNAPLSKQFTLADFQASPGYQFNLQQGQEAINKAASARGNYYAPQTLQDLSRFSQGLASQEFGNERQAFYGHQGNLFNRLFGVSQLGETAAAGAGALGAQSAQAQGGFLTQGANAQAAGLVGATNALTGGASSLYNNWLMNQILNNQPLYGGGGGTPGFMGVGAQPY